MRLRLGAAIGLVAIVGIAGIVLLIILAPFRAPPRPPARPDPMLTCRLDPATSPTLDTRTGTTFHTCGSQIVNQNGEPVQITGVSWFGIETDTYAPHGLWTR